MFKVLHEARLRRTIHITHAYTRLTCTYIDSVGSCVDRSHWPPPPPLYVCLSAPYAYTQRGPGRLQAHPAKRQQRRVIPTLLLPTRAAGRYGPGIDYIAFAPLGSLRLPPISGSQRFGPVQQVMMRAVSAGRHVGKGQEQQGP